MPALALDVADLPRDVDALIAIVVEQRQQYAATLESLRQQLSKLRQMTFGSRSERLTGQALLFTENLPIPPTPPKVPTTHVAAHDRKRRGRPALPADLPRVRKDYDLTEEQKAGFDRLVRIGEVVSSTLDVIPQKVFVIDHVRAKYRAMKDGAISIVVAEAQPSPIPKSNASAGLLAHVLVSKYADGLPLNRQERIFARHGIALSRTTLCDWILASTEKLAVLMVLLKAHVLGAPVLFADDTVLKLIEEGRRSARTARLWAYLSDGARQDSEGRWRHYPRAAYFEFTTTREAEHPTRFLTHYHGFLQADDYTTTAISPRFAPAAWPIACAGHTCGAATSMWPNSQGHCHWRTRRCGSLARSIGSRPNCAPPHPMSGGRRGRTRPCRCSRTFVPGSTATTRASCRARHSVKPLPTP